LTKLSFKDRRSSNCAAPCSSAKTDAADCCRSARLLIALMRMKWLQKLFRIICFVLHVYECRVLLLLNGCMLLFIAASFSDLLSPYVVIISDQCCGACLFAVFVLPCIDASPINDELCVSKCVFGCIF